MSTLCFFVNGPADVHVGFCVENSHRSNSVLPEDLVKVGGQVLYRQIDRRDTFVVVHFVMALIFVATAQWRS